MVGASRAAVAAREKKLLATPAGLNCKFAGETKAYYEVVAAAAAPRDRKKESGGDDDVNSQGKRRKAAVWSRRADGVPN